MIKPVFKKTNSAKKKTDTKSIFILDLLSNFRIFQMLTSAFEYPAFSSFASGKTASFKLQNLNTLKVKYNKLQANRSFIHIVRR